MTINKLKKINWKFYLERKSCIFYVSVFFEAYKNTLKRVTGFDFEQQLLWCKDGYVTYYRSERAKQDAEEFFINLVKTKDPQLQEWHKKGIETIRREEEFIEKIKEMTTQEIIKNYQQLMEECQDFFLYLTSIPFLILDAITSSGETYVETTNMFTIFRKASRTRLQELVFEKIWKVAAKKDHIGTMDAAYLTIQEVDALFNNKPYPKRDIEKRKKECIYFLGRQGTEFFYGDNLLEQVGIKQESTENTTELKGQVAYKGYAKGRVCILNREGDMKKFKKEDIIVSINTAPTLLPAIMKCKAIVANDGGLTSHAAIVARELKIPCVIGTKIATRILKDGDMVEVDAKKGTVKKL